MQLSRKFLLSRGQRRQRGQGMTEYIVVVALIAVAAIGIYTLFGQTLRNQTAGLALEIVEPLRLAAWRHLSGGGREVLRRAGGEAAVVPEPHLVTVEEDLDRQLDGDVPGEGEASS